MQTFLPYPDYRESMRVLDPKRLGNQVYREAMTLLNGGWKNHPASKMWSQNRYHLALYALAGLDELAERGKQYPKTEEKLQDILRETEDTGPPEWLGREDFHASHRSNLLKKDREWYGKFGWTEPDDLPYVWSNIVKPKINKPVKLVGGRNARQRLTI